MKRHRPTQYRKMIEDNPQATFGLSMAASAVYESRHGMCEDDHRCTEEWREIAGELRDRYGDVLTYREVRQELKHSIKSRSRGIGVDTHNRGS